MHTISVIYDTSYLMLPRFVSLRDIVENEIAIVENEIDFVLLESGRSVCSLEESVFKTRESVAVAEFVPREVIAEVRKHFDDGEKEQAARKARKRIARLLEQGAEEIDLPALDPSTPGGSLLGADSNTDRRIIQLAIAQSPRYSVAIVATDDGGILYDMVMLRRAGVAVYCHTKERWGELLKCFAAVWLHVRGYRNAEHEYDLYCDEPRSMGKGEKRG